MVDPIFNAAELANSTTTFMGDAVSERASESRFDEEIYMRYV